MSRALPHELRSKIERYIKSHCPEFTAGEVAKRFNVSTAAVDKILLGLGLLPPSRRPKTAREAQEATGARPAGSTGRASKGEVQPIRDASGPILAASTATTPAAQQSGWAIVYGNPACRGGIRLDEKRT